MYRRCSFVMVYVLFVNIFTVSDGDYIDDKHVIVNVINNAVIPFADAVTLAAF